MGFGGVLFKWCLLIVANQKLNLITETSLELDRQALPSLDIIGKQNVFQWSLFQVIIFVNCGLIEIIFSLPIF